MRSDYRYQVINTIALCVVLPCHRLMAPVRFDKTAVGVATLSTCYQRSK